MAGRAGPGRAGLAVVKHAHCMRAYVTKLKLPNTPQLPQIHPALLLAASFSTVLLIGWELASFTNINISFALHTKITLYGNE